MLSLSNGLAVLSASAQSADAQEVVHQAAERQTAPGDTLRFPVAAGPSKAEAVLTDLKLYTTGDLAGHVDVTLQFTTRAMPRLYGAVWRHLRLRHADGDPVDLLTEGPARSGGNLLTFRLPGLLEDAVPGQPVVVEVLWAEGEPPVLLGRLSGSVL